MFQRMFKSENAERVNLFFILWILLSIYYYDPAIFVGVMIALTTSELSLMLMDHIHKMFKQYVKLLTAMQDADKGA